MKNILILGAGLVAEPGIRYLLSEGKFRLTVADQDLARARSVINGHELGSAIRLDVNDTESLEDLVKVVDIVVSLLPWTFHPVVARFCLKMKKHLVTASYVSQDMSAFHEEAQNLGLVFLNEIGLDPGYDHMTAMQAINRIKSDGGKVLSFESITGGLPSPDDNNNPFGYKFSWSPKGVVLASTNPAEYLKDGNTISIPGEDLFLHFWNDKIDTIGDLEIYPNRNSLPYKKLYSLLNANTVFRGTYRYPGWCRTMKAISDLGWLSSSIPDSGSFLSNMAKITGARSNSPEDVLVATAEFLELTLDSDVIHKLDWLGLFSDSKLPENTESIDILCDAMESKMQYMPGERDMVVMQHRFGYEDSEGKTGELVSTLIEYGEPDGHSAMARTVSLPLASAVKAILSDKITTPGVSIPTTREIYEPVLKDLERSGITMVEKHI